MESPKEEANLKYDLHRAIEDENTFTLYEIWENEAGLAAHHEETYFKALVKLIEEGKLQEPPIIIPTSKM